MQTLPTWLTEALACPRDHARLDSKGDVLVCVHGHEYAVVEGIPIMLLDDVQPTHPYCEATLSKVRSGSGIESSVAARRDNMIDPFVQNEIVKTNGFLYQDLKGSLTRYPIPQIRLDSGGGKTLLDVGSNWGRWTVSASRKGYRAVGLDPSLDAILAATRVAKSLGVESWHVVGDARSLPFRDRAFDVGYSYGVFQHFSKEAARQSVTELGRVTIRGGTVLLQMPNIFGVRQAYNSAKATLRRYDEPFRIRYWTPRELVEMFETRLGPCEVSVDGFFALNPQAADLDLLSRRYAAIVRASEALRRLSQRRGFEFITSFADSLYLRTSENGSR